MKSLSERLFPEMGPYVSRVMGLFTTGASVCPEYKAVLSTSVALA